MKTRISLITLMLLSPLVFSEEKQSDVIVVGGGIVGASIAYHLSKDGLNVTVLEREKPASHASRGTFAWLNASWAKQPFAYHQLNQQSVSYWHELSVQLDIPVKWGGSLEWFSSQKRSATLVSQIEEQARWDEPARIISTKQAEEIEPNVSFPSGSVIAFSENDGALDPQLATHKLLDAAKKLGTNVLYPCKVISLEIESSQAVVTEECGKFSAKKIVLAVGANSTFIKATTGLTIPQRSTPGVIAVTKPLPNLIDRIIVAPGVHIHQRLDGRIVIGEQAGAPDNAQHKERLARRPNSYPNNQFANQHFQQLLALATVVIPEIASAEMESMYIGWRPLPLDGHPVLGYTNDDNDVYIAIMHSGVTLAPIVGKLVALEIQNQIQDQLAPYRPNRDFDLIQRY